MKTDRIKNSHEPNSLIKAPNYFDVNSKKITFSFELFNPQSVKNQRINYNSFYQNIESSRNAVSNFFNILKELSRYKISEVMSSNTLRDTYHLGPIYIDGYIDKIESILKEDYGYPLKTIAEFDRQYYEFQISDGKRVIWHKVENVMMPLFIDANHMICIDSSRNVKAKMKFAIKSSFDHQNEVDLSQKDIELKELLQMLIDDFDENNDSYNRDDIIDFIRTIIK